MTVSAEAFKGALANLASGVVIVTTSGADGRASGMTATAVCSVSIEPPLVMACMSHATATYQAVSTSGVFALNVLPARSEDLARLFASTRSDKFEGLTTTTDATGAPVLAAAMAHCDCIVERTVEAGDHTIFIGRVQAVSYVDDENRRPLLYFRGGYGVFAPPVGGSGERAEAAPQGESASDSEA